MSQEAVEEFLKKHPNDWFLPKDMYKHIGVNHATASASCSKLRKHDDVLYRPTQRQGMYKYKYKPEDTK